MELSKAKAEMIGHLGLIASTIQDSGMMKTIDDILGHVAGGLSYGQRVGAMVLNGLGFINTALYMTPRFFHDKPLDLLLGKNVCAEQLNDDSLGRCLDKIAAYGNTKWYSEIALSVLKNFDLLSNLAHLDSTSLTLYGSYNNCGDEVSPKPLLGYSKDHRPDLKQVTLQWVSLGKGTLPIWMESLDGNSSDKKSFPETVQRVNAFYKQLHDAPAMCFVADSALYHDKMDKLPVNWITRVPENYSEAKNLCKRVAVEWNMTSDERYQVFPYKPQEKPERWLLVRSKPAFEKEYETFLKNHQKNFEILEKSLWHCSCEAFGCEKDAEKAINKAIRIKKHFYKVIYRTTKKACFNGKGRPCKNRAPDYYTYHVHIDSITSDLAAIQAKKETLGRFILATNVSDTTVLSDEAMLSDYKEQSSIERGFRFIKDDTFGLDEVYLKKPSRIGALMAIMTLCLLVYGLTQHRLHTALKSENEVLPNQKKKPTQTPTLMWIFTLFASLTMVNIQGHRVLLNIQPLHKKVILLLGNTAKKIYLLPIHMKHNDVLLNQKSWLRWCGI